MPNSRASFPGVRSRERTGSGQVAKPDDFWIHHVHHHISLEKSNKANIKGGRGLNVHPLDPVKALDIKHIFQHVLMVYWTKSEIFQFSN